MSNTEDRDEITGKTVAEMGARAEDLYAHRDDAEGDEVRAEYPAEVRSVVSVRFSRTELDSVASAAAAASQPASQPPVDVHPAMPLSPPRARSKWRPPDASCGLRRGRLTSSGGPSAPRHSGTAT